jgi:hypothetical protein
MVVKVLTRKINKNLEIKNKVLEWKKNNFSPEEMEEWLKYNFNLKQAIFYRDKGYTAADAYFEILQDLRNNSIDNESFGV